MTTIWRTHTGSAPGCQSTPREIIGEWFGNDVAPTLDDIDGLWQQLLEYHSDIDGEHRCFNRCEYELTKTDVAQIVRELVDERE